MLLRCALQPPRVMRWLFKQQRLPLYSSCHQRLTHPYRAAASQSCSTRRLTVVEATHVTSKTADLAASRLQPDDTHAALDSGLYVVGTPIGNLEDMSFRAVRVLREAATILAEDTRHSRKLLNHYGINTPLQSCHEHNEHERAAAVVRQLDMGAALAIISDAGMPGISDPGSQLVAAVLAAGHRVIPIPGPCAMLSALVASGLPTAEFMFVGFLPAKTVARQKRLQEVAGTTATLLLYAPPHGLAAVLQDAAAVLGGHRRCTVARELTKLHEEFYRSTLEQAVSWASDHPIKGEITVVIEGASENRPTYTDADIVERLHHHIEAGVSSSQAVKEVSQELGIGRKQVYALAVKLSD